MPDVRVTIGPVSEDAPKGRIAAWEDRHRGVATRGSLVALLLIAAVVLFLVFRGGSGKHTCALYNHSSKMHLVIRAPGSSGETRRVCRLLASELSGAGSGRFSASSGSTDFNGEMRACAVSGNQAEVAVYAKRRTASTRALCSLIEPPTGSRATEVVSVHLPPHPLVYLVLTGPSAAIKFIAQRIVSQSSKKNGRGEVVSRPHGRKLCTFHRGPLSVTIYAPNRSAGVVGANICSGSIKVF